MTTQSHSCQSRCSLSAVCPQWRQQRADRKPVSFSWSETILAASLEIQQSTLQDSINLSFYTAESQPPLGGQILGWQKKGQQQSFISWDQGLEVSADAHPYRRNCDSCGPEVSGFLLGKITQWNAFTFDVLSHSCLLFLHSPLHKTIHFIEFFALNMLMWFIYLFI